MICGAASQWRRCRLAAALTLATLVAPAGARAALQICNQTSYVVDAATGVEQASHIQTRGWTRLVPGDCATAIAEPLRAPAYFAFARSVAERVSPVRSWGGQFKLCAKDGPFTLTTSMTATSCGGPGVYQVPFAAVATGGARTWTMTLTESTVFATPDDARQAAFRRLLAETGDLKPGAADPKSVDAALARFRTRAHLAANVAPAQLFAALEAAARNPVTGAGYAICNDGDSDIFAALGFRQGREFVSRGWWQVAVGACVTAVAEALGHDAVYLYASKHGNPHLVSGTVPFCITNAEFEYYKQGNCTGQGYSAMGFLATNLKGLPSFTAHIGRNGLIGP